MIIPYMISKDVGNTGNLEILGSYIKLFIKILDMPGNDFIIFPV